MYVLGIIFVVGITQHPPLERNAMNRKLDGYVMVECMYYIVKHIEYGLDPWIGAKSKVNEQKISKLLQIIQLIAPIQFTVIKV